MKVLLLIPLLLASCSTLQDIVPSFNSPDTINEINFMKTPCILDGTIVKKKPKVPNV